MIKKEKGQILVFEQVLIFFMAVSIFVASFALFTTYEKFYTSSTSQDQLSNIKEYLLSHIIRICEKKDANSSVVISIPRRIGNNLYRVRLTDVGLNLTIIGDTESERSINDFSPLYLLNETFDFSGMVVSDSGKIVIYKTDKNVFFGGR